MILAVISTTQSYSELPYKFNATVSGEGSDLNVWWPGSSGTGDGTSNGSHSIDVGFQPRFIIIKQNNGTNWKNYVVIDTLRGEDNIMYLNADTAQSSSDLIDISSTGWSFKSSDELVNSNENSNRYIYYAHA